MDFSMPVNVNKDELNILIAAYSSNDCNYFKSVIENMYRNKISKVTVDISELITSKSNENNVSYLEQVIDDSIQMIRSKKKSLSLNSFLNDLNFSIINGKKVLLSNFDNIDILSDHLIELHTTEELSYNLLDYIYNHPNNLAKEMTQIVESLLVNNMDIRKVCSQYMQKLLYMQTHTLNIINKVQQIKLCVINNQEEDEDEE